MPIGGPQRPGVGGSVVSSGPPSAQVGPGLLIRGPYDAPDEVERMLTHASGAIAQCLAGGVESEINSFLQEKAASGPLQHAEVINGLIFNILTESFPPAQLISYMQLVTRDKYTGCLLVLQRVVAEKWTKLADGVVGKVLWMLEQLIGLGVPETEGLLFCLLRQIAGGDVTPPNLWLANAMLELLTRHRSWLYTCPGSVGLAVFTYLRLIPDHSGRKVQELRQREAAFCCQTLRERLEDCLAVGRDLVRVLQEATAVPELDRIWKDLHSAPAVFGVPDFSDISQLYCVRTPSRYITSRVTPEMETQIRFLLTHVRMGNQRRYQTWFSHRFLAGPESETLVPDLLRFVCCVVHPTNQILSSDVVPRWAIVGWLLKCCKSQLADASAKLAVFYDWLFFQDTCDNIMNIEPAVLLMVHSIPKYADITNALLHCLFHLLDTYDPPRRELLFRGVTTSLSVLTTKGVVNSLEGLVATPLIRPPLVDKLRSYFPAFCNSPHHSDARPASGRGAAEGGEGDRGEGRVEERDVEGRSKRKRAAEQREELQGELKVHFEILKASVAGSQEKAAEALEHLIVFVTSSEEGLWGGKVMRTAGHGDVSRQTTTAHISLEEQTALANQIREVVAEGGYHLCSPLRKMPSQELSPDETGSLTSILLRLYVINRHPLLRSMLLTWQGAGCNVSARLLCYVARLGEELEMAESREDGEGEGEGEQSQEEEAVAAAFEAYHQLQGEGREKEGLEADLGTCLVWNTYRFLRLLPLVFRYLPHLAGGSVNIIQMLVGVGDPVELASMETSLAAGDYCMGRWGGGADPDEACCRLVEASLEWDSYEQGRVWQLVRAESVGWTTASLCFLLERIVGACKKRGLLPEALSGIAACVSGRPPDAGLVAAVLGMPPVCGRVRVAIFITWTSLHPAALCTCLRAEAKRREGGEGERGKQGGGRTGERMDGVGGLDAVVGEVMKRLRRRQKQCEGDASTRQLMSALVQYTRKLL